MRRGLRVEWPPQQSWCWLARPRPASQRHSHGCSNLPAALACRALFSCPPSSSPAVLRPRDADSLKAGQVLGAPRSRDHTQVGFIFTLFQKSFQAGQPECHWQQPSRRDPGPRARGPGDSESDARAATAALSLPVAAAPAGPQCQQPEGTVPAVHAQLEQACKGAGPARLGPLACPSEAAGQVTEPGQVTGVCYHVTRPKSTSRTRCLHCHGGHESHKAAWATSRVSPYWNLAQATLD